MKACDSRTMLEYVVVFWYRMQWKIIIQFKLKQLNDENCFDVRN